METGKCLDLLLNNVATCNFELHFTVFEIHLFLFYYNILPQTQHCVFLLFAWVNGGCVLQQINAASMVSWPQPALPVSASRALWIAVLWHNLTTTTTATICIRDVTFTMFTPPSMCVCVCVYMSHFTPLTSSRSLCVKRDPRRTPTPLQRLYRSNWLLISNNFASSSSSTSETWTVLEETDPAAPTHPHTHTRTGFYGSWGPAIFFFLGTTFEYSFMS